MHGRIGEEGRGESYREQGARRVTEARIQSPHHSQANRHRAEAEADEAASRSGPLAAAAEQGYTRSTAMITVVTTCTAPAVSSMVARPDMKTHVDPSGSPQDWQDY